MGLVLSSVQEGCFQFCLWLLYNTYSLSFSQGPILYVVNLPSHKLQQSFSWLSLPFLVFCLLELPKFCVLSHRFSFLMSFKSLHCHYWLSCIFSLSQPKISSQTAVISSYLSPFTSQSGKYMLSKMCFLFFPKNIFFWILYFLSSFLLKYLSMSLRLFFLLLLFFRLNRRYFDPCLIFLKDCVNHLLKFSPVHLDASIASWFFSLSVTGSNRLYRLDENLGAIEGLWFTLCLVRLLSWAPVIFFTVYESSPLLQVGTAIPLTLPVVLLPRLGKSYCVMEKSCVFQLPTGCYYLWPWKQQLLDW